MKLIMNSVLFNAILSRIQKEILEHKEEFEDVRRIDMRYSEIKVELPDLIKVIDGYKNKDITNLEKEICVYCNGNPYIVLNLLLLGVTKGISMKIDIEDTMLGINTYILEIVKMVSEENNIKVTFEFSKGIIADNMIFIDRSNDYDTLRSKVKNAVFIPYQAVDIYCDSDKYHELLETIYEYAMSMNIEANIFDKSESVENVLKFGTAGRILFLTDKRKKIPSCENKKVYINENLFKEEEIMFNNEIIENIIKSLSH